MEPTVLPYAPIASLTSLLVNSSSAQSPGTPAALFKAHEEVVTDLDRAAAIINSAAGVSISISPGISTGSELVRSAVCCHATIQRGNLPYHRRKRHLGDWRIAAFASRQPDW